MPHVKNWIKEHGPNWLNKLVEDYKIEVVRDRTQENLVSLKYNQIESPMSEPIVQECRGMVVLDNGHDSKILAHPYNKFWNHGEGRAVEIDWTTARVQDKLDGSLSLLYTDENTNWRFASSGSPRGSGSYGMGNSVTFGDMFRKVFNDSDMLFPSDTEVTYCFELVAPDNRIVVMYDKPQLILHGARHRNTEQELSRHVLEQTAKAYNWPIVKEWPIGTIDDALKAAKDLDPVKLEGFVVVDGNFNRVKIKSPRYVVLHHMRDKITDRGVIKLWLEGEVEELLVYFPEHAPAVKKITDQLEDLVLKSFELYMAHRDLPTRKDYAMMVKDTPYSGFCFRMMNDKISTYEDALRVVRTFAYGAVEKHLGFEPEEETAA